MARETHTEFGTQLRLQFLVSACNVCNSQWISTSFLDLHPSHMDCSELLHILNLLITGSSLMVLEISKPTEQPSDSVDKEMIRTVLQGTYSRTKPGWTRVPWCIIKVMVAMFPNLAPGPGQLTLH